MLDINLGRAITFVEVFLSEANGGARLVAIWAALSSLLNENAKVRAGAPTDSDRYSGTVGDVEVLIDEKLVSASECKHRPLTSDDVLHGIKKARDGGVPQYLFVCAAGLVAEQQDRIHKAISDASQSVDLAIVDIFDEAPTLLKMIGPSRRALFGESVVTFLRSMRRPDAANEAAELWNCMED